ncbi:MAG: DeoR/GlpR family DNA-binding transcription regulator [Phycisphaerae bacterium]|jgi:DeoR/GlpR family transcriptional regulator of sugar metabolism
MNKITYSNLIVNMVTKKNLVPAQQRLEKIRDMLSRQSSVSVSHLARLLKVSEMTIHRDLAKLEQTSSVRKTYGGAVVAEQMIFEFDFAARRKANQRAKQAIAHEAVKLIKPGARIILDTGTTTLELAQLLKDFGNLTVITPSLAVASVLQFSKGVQTILLGGSIREGSPDLTGAVTEATLAMFAADIAFQGADGIGLNGELFNTDMRIAKVDQKIRRRAKRTYILSDSSKIGQTDLASNGMLSEAEALITDSKITKEQLSELKKTGTKIIICEI